MRGGDVNAAWASVFLDELARCGVREIVVAPGSRSTPLVLAAAADARFRMVSVVDERSAGFLALGIGKASRVPAAVITTSGTAGANLFPSVIEASQAEVPLLVLTADRPHRLRDTDANQAMDQLRLFGGYPRMFAEVAPPRLADGDLKHLRVQACRAVAAAQGAPAGPVHLNFPFEKPLEPTGSLSDLPPEGVSHLAWKGREGGQPFTRVPPVFSYPSRTEVDDLLELFMTSSRGLIVAGPHPNPRRAGAAALTLARATNFPLLADPLSGARFGPPGGARVVAGYDLFLRSPSVRQALAPDLVLRLGATPTSAALLRYLQDHPETPQIIVDDGHRWKDHLGTGHLYLRTSPEALVDLLAEDLRRRSGDEGWLGLWESFSDRALRRLGAAPVGSLPEGQVMSRVVEAMPSGSALLIGNSMPIREFDAFVPRGGEEVSVFGNRGTSGIDGLVSTTIGIGAATKGKTVGVLGDLSFFHDMNGLLTLKREKFPVGFVVVNNDGGGIFQTLPVRDHEPAFSRFFLTPHGLDFKDVAELYDLTFARVEKLEDLPGLLGGLLENGEPFILEVPVRRAEAHGARGAFMEALVTAFEEDELA